MRVLVMVTERGVEVKISLLESKTSRGRRTREWCLGRGTGWGNDKIVDAMRQQKVESVSD